MPNTCPRCQGATEPGDVFCPNCGAALATPGGDATVTMPIVQAPPAAQGQPMPPAKTPGVMYAPPAAARSRPWYRKKRFMIPLTFLLIFGMLAGAGAWYLNQQFGDLQSVSTPDPNSAAGLALKDPTPEVTPTKKNSVTMLLMGVDSRPGEPIDIGVRADSLSVLHINNEAKTCRIITIPRDTRTELPGYGQSKINHALSVGGIDYQKLVVQNTLGIEIDHYALVDFGGVVGTVNALGGVDVYNQSAFELDGVQFAQGNIHLNGDEALLYSRFRGDSEGDFGRQRRQQEVVRAMLNKANGLDAARAIPSLLSSIQGHFKTDLGVTDLIGMANKYRDHCTADRVQSAGLEGTVGNDYDELMAQELSFVHVSTEEINIKVDWLLGD